MKQFGFELYIFEYSCPKLLAQLFAKSKYFEIPFCRWSGLFKVLLSFKILYISSLVNESFFRFGDKILYFLDEKLFECLLDISFAQALFDSRDEVYLIILGSLNKYFSPIF